MKKIISMFLAVVMIASMSLVAFAEEYPATVTLDSKTIEVAEGTQDVTLNITFTLSEEAVTSMLAIGFDLPDGVTIKEYDGSQYGALLGDGLTLASDDVLEDGLITLFEDGGSNFAVDTFAIPVTFTVETSEAKEYEIKLDPENTILCDPDSVPLNDVETLPTATITVAEAKKPTVLPVDAKETDVIIDNTQYMGTAIYEVDFDLKNTVDAEKEYGITFGETEIVSTVGGEGTVKYVLAFYGVTGELDVNTFWTAK